MKEITNKTVSTKIVQPFYSSGTVPVADSNQILGATKQVDTYDDLAKLESWDLREGTLVYCKEGDTDGNHWFQYNSNGEFEIFTTSSKVIEKNIIGYPILDQEAINKASTDVPTDYIQIPNKDTDFNGSVKKNTYKTSINGNYVDILFQSLRALQDEVTKLRNSFLYGIDTYTGTETISGRVTSEDGDESEPLWAIERSNLNSLQYVTLDTNHKLVPSYNVGIKTDYLTINNKATFTADSNVTRATDSQLFLYITASKRDITINLASSNDTKSIDLQTLDISYSESYNIQLVISRTKNTAGQNYIWIYITDAEGNTLYKGYYDSDFTQTKKLLDSNYTISTVELNDLDLYDLEICSKDELATNNIDPVIPDRSENKYKAAYIQERVIDTKDNFDKVFKYLPDRTFVWVSETLSLYFIVDKKKYKINGSSNSDEPSTDDTMTTYELLENLQKSGIISIDSLKQAEDGTITYNNITLNDIAQIKFINENTKEKFILRLNSEGSLESIKDTQDIDTAEYIMDSNGKKISFAINSTNYDQYRGFLANTIFNFTDDSDAKLKADRLKIGAFYAPMNTDTTFGCSHAFVELENTSDQDINLEGYILHYAGPIIGTNSQGETIQTQATYHLALKGIIPSGGTYLIRGKRYTDDNLPQTYIKVNTYDIEWYACDNGSDWFTNGKQCGIDYTPQSDYTYELNMLIDFTSYDDTNIRYGFALTYQKPDLLATDQITRADENGNYVYVRPFVVDCLNLYTSDKSHMFLWNNVNSKAATPLRKSNTLYRNTFELDPAKQAFQALSLKDSSRLRSQTDDDYMYLNLDKQYIQFPHSKDTYDVSHFTPKASFEHKNVCTDKTQLDLEKPNMPTVSLGMNVYTTRCFNWLSVGKYDEYVFLRKKGTTTWNRFESYTKKFYNATENYTIGKTYQIGAQVVFNDCLLQCLQTTVAQEIPDYNAWNDISLEGNIIKSSNYPQRVEFPIKINNAAYSRITNTLPASNILYTAHKCIVQVVEDAILTDPVEYEWCVGRSNYDSTPQEGHVSDILTFTLYPKNSQPRLYQTTDQQGFHWVEYQVWAASAIKVNEHIKKDLESFEKFQTSMDTTVIKGKSYYLNNKLVSNPTGNPSTNNYQERIWLMPIVINTGDMTQNGTRINEWLDYYQASLPLSSHLEQMYVVGNNDLGNPNPNSLGTGDDPGKSNPYFYNLCYCYEVPKNEYTPLFTGTDGQTRYIPSLYYFDTDAYRIIMVNSEITSVTDAQTYYTPLNNGVQTDLYTGYPITGGDASATYQHPNIKGEHYIYELLYQWTNTSRTKIIACHEMPFTVITQSNLYNSTLWVDRSLNASNGNLIGSHMNRPFSNSSQLHICRSKGLYWFSRLLEYRNIHYCIGGHKHTYAMTWPVRENYYYKTSTSDTTWKHSLTDGPMTMNSTLESDLVNFITYNGTPISQNSDITIQNTSPEGAYYSGNIVNLTKQPLIKKELVDGYIANNTNYGTENNSMYDSYIPDQYSNASYTVYLMCQATGFKLKSNKELPGNYQRFSAIIPKTNVKSSGDTPDNEQQSPMYVIIDCDTSPSFELIKLWNINNGSTSYSNIANAKFKFTQQDYSSSPIQEYYYSTNAYPKGTWTSTQNNLNLNL